METLNQLNENHNELSLEELDEPELHDVPGEWFKGPF